ncbi:winged helix-turn-helix domain-containing protein [Halobacteria archaeon AArc-m2/3/4]|uniref:Winged helix-turn-helix domain-containing protein n=1 Tax=Natronoglomus mannanivorans TaxID=2979990 RepID=A0AAP3E369_9EURY|nr:winged helix-turn-helix domain-containing protein [Halobacteria archaeon AArc-xg1-1]MCU4972911.1 winged helix-turn-helix domain-containing protein [Halobacteria archaeon AArc-m2/3/4]
MEGTLWYVLSGTRGGPNRIRMLAALEERPRNANQLSELLELDYSTIRHHLDVLGEHGVVEKTGETYGVVYHPTKRTKRHWNVVERIEDSLIPA